MKNGVRGPYLYLFQVPKGEVHENVAKGIFKDIMSKSFSRTDEESQYSDSGAQPKQDK